MEKNKDKSQDYNSALERLEEIVNSIENQSLDSENLASQVKEANTLIQFCTTKLEEVNKEVEKLLTTQDKPNE